jgi:hypothetical protein
MSACLFHWPFDYAYDLCAFRHIKLATATSLELETGLIVTAFPCVSNAELAIVNSTQM